MRHAPMQGACTGTGKPAQQGLLARSQMSPYAGLGGECMQGQGEGVSPHAGPGRQSGAARVAVWSPRLEVCLNDVDGGWLPKDCRWRLAAQ